MYKKTEAKTNVADRIITADNLQRASELITLGTLRSINKYPGASLDKMLTDLSKDIDRKSDINHIFSNGYDAVQEVACFLSGHIGKKFSDAAGIGTDRKGNVITINKACFKIAGRYILEKKTNMFRALDIDGLNEKLLSVPFECDDEELEDYTAVDATIERMMLTDKQREVLTYVMNGKALNEVSKILCLAATSVYQRMHWVRRKYFKHISPCDPRV